MELNETPRITSTINQTWKHMKVKFEGSLDELKDIEGSFNDYVNVLNALIIKRQEYNKIIERYTKDFGISIAGVMSETPSYAAPIFTPEDMLTDQENANRLASECVELEAQKQILFRELKNASTTSLTLFYHGAQGSYLILDQLNSLSKTASSKRQFLMKQKSFTFSPLETSTSNEIENPEEILNKEEPLSLTMGNVFTENVNVDLAISKEDQLNIYESLNKNIKELHKVLPLTKDILEHYFNSTINLITLQRDYYDLLVDSNQDLNTLDFDQTLLIKASEIETLQKQKRDLHQNSQDVLIKINKLLGAIDEKSSLILNIIGNKISSKNMQNSYNAFNYTPVIFGAIKTN